nr:immunoglobulin light chain junction region [Macaca mulatta]
CMQALEFPPTL